MRDGISARSRVRKPSSNDSSGVRFTLGARPNADQRVAFAIGLLAASVNGVRPCARISTCTAADGMPELKYGMSAYSAPAVLL